MAAYVNILTTGKCYLRYSVIVWIKKNALSLVRLELNFP